MDTLTAYNKTHQQTQEMLVKTHTVLVKRIAHHLLLRLPHTVQLDDLIQAGMLGLLEALRLYDSTKGASFETYASIRVRGHMLDEVRRNDWVPRAVYRNSRMISDAVKKVENRIGRGAKDNEIAKELNLNIEEYYEMIKDSVKSQLYGFEDLGVTDDILQDDDGRTTEPYRKALRDDLANQLSQLMENLPKNERSVLYLYYVHDLNLKEIGEILGVTESRVSQIHSQATQRIKSRWGEGISDYKEYSSTE